MALIQSQHQPASRPTSAAVRLAFTRLRLHPSVSREDHDALREGTKLGVYVATATWLWIALVDAASGDVFRTPMMLGGIVTFTVAHFVLNLVYSVSLVSVIRSAAREPSLIMAALFGFVMVELGFIMITAVLSLFLGGVAWVSIFGGSLIGAAIAFRHLSLRHPLGALMTQAETER